MAKINKDQKLKIFLLFLLSNTSVYLLSSTESPSPSNSQNEVIYREDYREVLIKGELFIPPEEGKEITLKNKNQDQVIPHAIFLREYKNQVDEYSDIIATKKYIIYIDKKYLAQNLISGTYQILPFGTEIKMAKKIKRKSYEINY